MAITVWRDDGIHELAVQFPVAETETGAPVGGDGANRTA